MRMQFPSHDRAEAIRKTRFRSAVYSVLGLVVAGILVILFQDKGPKAGETWGMPDSGLILIGMAGVVMVLHLLEFMGSRSVHEIVVEDGMVALYFGDAIRWHVELEKVTEVRLEPEIKRFGLLEQPSRLALLKEDGDSHAIPTGQMSPAQVEELVAEIRRQKEARAQAPG